MSKERTMKGFRRSEHVIEISDTVGGHVIIMNYTVLKVYTLKPQETSTKTV